MNGASGVERLPVVLPLCLRLRGCSVRTNFSTGKSHSFGGEYVELTPHERIRYTDRFESSDLPGEMHVSVTLKTVACGTEVEIVQEGIPAAIPVEFCYLGWQESLALLAHLVEPDIPDGP